MTAPIPAWIDGRLVPVDKLDAHRRGLRHKAVSVFVVRGSKLLIQQRAAAKYHTPGLWANTCCTHPGWAEAAAECATRRLREELGITGLSLAHRDVIEYRADVGGGLIEHEVVDLFLAVAPPDLEISPDPDEVMAVDWVDIFALSAAALRHPERYTPWLRIYLAQYRDLIFGDLARA